ncbi:MAG: ABC transporter permease [Bacilli bacterium]|nr:ABC transporter permease [Bacilli bacterium]
MIVFKAFLKILDKCKVPILMYTAFLIFFGGYNMKSSDTSMSFTASKPDIYIINQDENVGITKDFIAFLTEKSNVKSIEAEKIDDALFYRDVNYVVYIPKGFNREFWNDKEPQIEVKSTGDYLASLAHMYVQKYLRLAHLYKDIAVSDEELLRYIHQNLEHEVQVELTTQLDTNGLTQATFYFNFMNYCLLAGCIYVICLVLSSFKEENINKRTIISSMNYKKHSWYLLLSNGLFAVVLWFVYILLSVFLIGKVMFSIHGVLYMINAFVFTLCALTIAFLIGSVVHNKEAVNGIVNVVALGSSFLCGSFVPAEYLPKLVVTIAHVLPSYWFIDTNNLIKTVEVANWESLKPIGLNLFVIVCFCALFVGITLFVSKRKRKID